MPDEPAIFDSFRAARDRGVMPTAMDTQELRQLSAIVRARAFFSARMSHAGVVARVNDIINQALNDEIGLSKARALVMQAVRESGYTPESGFPGEEGVPEAPAGSLRDLSSFKRADLIVRTQLNLMQGAGQQARGQSPARLAVAPAWELVRKGSPRAPRHYIPGDEGEADDKTSPEARWLVAGGTIYPGGRMIALKGDPVWGELGSSENFDDALDVDYPPFFFNSTMRWNEVLMAECRALQVTGPDGQSIDAWLASGARTLTGGQIDIGDMTVSTRGVPQEIVDEVKRQTGAREGQGKLILEQARQRFLRKSAEAQTRVEALYAR